MKRVLRPEKKVPEKADYICDFTGKRLGDSPPAHIEIWCGYPSNRDGVTYNLHLSDEALDELMIYLRLRLLPRKVRDAGRSKLDGCRRGERVRSGPEDAKSKRQLKAAITKQLE